ncbi:MAG: hypothetical protein M3066_14155 [Actinomycetota bacterium]|nr:hypothetical protein [Actinomycetota bacterium]
MTRSLRPFILTAVAAVLVGMFENILFGRDTPGTAHDVSILFFFLFAAGVCGLLTTGVTALIRRVRRGGERGPVPSTHR